MMSPRARPSHAAQSTCGKPSPQSLLLGATLLLLAGCATEARYTDPASFSLAPNEVAEVSILAQQPVSRAGAFALFKDDDGIELLDKGMFADHYRFFTLAPGNYLFGIRCEGYQWSAHGSRSLRVEKGGRYRLTCLEDESGESVRIKRERL